MGQCPTLKHFQPPFAGSRKVRELESANERRVPIVTLTANAFDEVRARCLAAGMDRFLTKPVSPSDLLAEIERVISRGANAANGTRVDTIPAGEPALE